jgi:hypothetical protein
LVSNQVLKFALEVGVCCRQPPAASRSASAPSRAALFDTAFFLKGEFMPLPYRPGSKAPTAADITSLLSLPVSNCTLTDLKIIEDYCQRRPNKDSTNNPATEPTLGTYLP